MVTRPILAAPAALVLLVMAGMLTPGGPPRAVGAAATPGAARESTREVPPEAPAEGRCRVCALAGRLGLRMTPLQEVQVTRCVCYEDPPLLAALPRGRVSAADLGDVEVELGLDLFDEVPAFERDPHLEVRCGDLRLGRLALEGRHLREASAFPAEVLTRLRGLRGRITWGRFDLRDRHAQAAIWLEEASPRERARWREVRAGTEGAEPWVARLMEAQLLQDQAFDTAALRLARRVLDEQPNEPHAAALAQAAYRLLGLRETPTGHVFEAELVRPLMERRRAAGVRCGLEEPLPEGLARRAAEPEPCGADR